MLVSWHQSVGSTNDVAAALAADGRRSPFVVAARQQAAGRGRAGRPWQSPLGGAWLSLAWLPPEPWDAWTLAPLAVGLAVRKTLAPYLDQPDTLTLKWPNDLLIDNHKVAGILCERPWPKQPEHDWLIAGVGINVHIETETLGDNLRIPPASLHNLANRTPSVDDIVEAVADHMITTLRLAGSETGRHHILREAEQHLAWKHQPVILRHAAGTLHGRIAGLAPTGELILENDNGAQRLVAAGDVEQLAPETRTPSGLHA